MVKKYFYTILLAVCFFSVGSYAQDKQQPRTQEATIEGLAFYPNPVSDGKVFITSKQSLNKEITIYDVLGKVVLQTTLSGSELSVASLSPGVYMVRIKEGDATASRKLIIK